MSDISSFSPNSEREPAHFNVSTRSYKDLNFAERLIGDEVVFVIKGKVTSVSEDFEDKSAISLSMEVETIEDHSTRSELDKDGRVK